MRNQFFQLLNKQDGIVFIEPQNTQVGLDYNYTEIYKEIVLSQRLQLYEDLHGVLYWNKEYTD